MVVPDPDRGHPYTCSFNMKHLYKKHEAEVRQKIKKYLKAQ